MVKCAGRNAGRTQDTGAGTGSVVTEPDLTLKEVALRLDKATSTIERAASGLVKAGRLRFVGPRKRGRWELL